MKNIMKFDDKEVSIILDALKALILLLKNVHQARPKHRHCQGHDLNPALYHALQFERQMKEAEALINKIESFGY